MFGFGKKSNFDQTILELQYKSQSYFNEAVVEAAKSKSCAFIDEKARRKHMDLAIVASAKSVAIQEAIDIIKAID